MIYFVEAIGMNLVKIGYTEKDVQFRFNKMVPDSPVELAIISTKEGSKEDEARIQSALNEYCVRGEWYALTEKVREFIDIETRPFAKVSTVERSTTQKILGSNVPHGGQALIKFRRRRNMTQPQLADMLGTSTATISRYEDGIRPIPLKKILDVSRVTGVPMYELCPIFGAPQPEQAA